MSAKKNKKHNAWEKDYIWNSDACSCENVEYLASTYDDSVITSDENINDADILSTNVSTNVTSTVLKYFHKEK